MSIEMKARAAPAPVSRLRDLPPLERCVVAGARLWRDGRTCGAAPAAQMRLDELLRILHAHGRRPLLLGVAGADGVGGDEAVLARLVALAAEGAREDAALIATLLVRADVAFGLARIAEALGHHLLRSRRPQRHAAWS